MARTPFVAPGDGAALLRDLYIDGVGPRPQSPLFNHSTNGLLFPASYPPTRHGGRGSAWSSGGRARPAVGRPRSLSARSRTTTHIWREPSPDVWSIEEETDEDLKGQQQQQHGRRMSEGAFSLETKKAAKPKKKVRFVLPSTN